jgi:hypothetical protein
MTCSSSAIAWQTNRHLTSDIAGHCIEGLVQLIAPLLARLTFTAKTGEVG